MTAGVRVLEGFAGPGGLSESLRMLGITGALGIEKNADACATAEAAGHRRVQADIRSLDPEDFLNAHTWASGPPCPTYSDSGKRSGLTDYRIVLDGIARLADTNAGTTRHGHWRDTYQRVSDERTALVLETLRFAFRLPNVRVVVAEQVPAVHDIWAEICAELAATMDWASCNVIRVRFSDFGAATRRERVILIACRDHMPDFAGLPLRGWWSCGRFDAPRINVPGLVAPVAAVSMAGALGWPAGVWVNTRGERKTPGGNLFRADGPAPSLTGNGARSWYRTDLGKEEGKLTPSQAGRLQGFPADYPWQGSRSSQFQRIADSVSPLVGAAVLGAAMGLPWRDAVQERIERIYPPDALKPRTGQLDLLAEAA
jgi:DNA (cytosine-5)-methyltransferase 1